MTTARDLGLVGPDALWVRADIRTPVQGEKVDLSRDARTVLDTVYWNHTEAWNLSGLFWRSAS